MIGFCLSTVNHSLPTGQRTGWEVRRILLVDDEVVGLEIPKDLLESTGYEAGAVRSGPGALEKLSGGFDPVVLDIMLPQMDGYDIIRRMIPV